MNLADLKVFVGVARYQSLAGAAAHLHLTPSAISKALKRLEESLGSELFDRSSRQLALNHAGHRLVERARLLLALAEQARADLQGEGAAIDCRIGGPAVLLWRDGPRLARALAAHPAATLRLQAMFEDDALAALARGEIGAAIVTSAVTEGRGPVWSPDWTGVPLGPLVLHLVAGAGHPLAARGRRRTREGACRASTAEVLAHPFVCPTRSLFCGEQRGARSDGWRDDALPRTIRYWTDDLQLLLAFVRSGDALAYLPQAALAEPGLVRIEVEDCPFTCGETAWLVWNARTAPQWLRRLAAAVQTPEPDSSAKPTRIAHQEMI
jgi:DNA-binding transcriptional LysR family regulator